MGKALRLVMRKDGLRGLMRGAGMRTLWIAPQGCVYYPVYELVLAVLEKNAREKSEQANGRRDPQCC